MFPVHDVSDWDVDEIDEQLGTKEKCWLHDRQWLFKQVREGADGPSGEDWAEKLVEQLGRLLGVPVAEVQLALRHGHRGIISKSFVPPDSRLEHGNELLVRVDPDYDREQARRNPRYTVRAVKEALEGVEAPSDHQELSDFTGFDVWSGYLLLDAWVAGRDRHHENWGAIATGHRRELAPSFDHGNALGFQEPREVCARLVANHSALEKWARRGKSHHFAGKPRLTELAQEALGLASPQASDYWKDRLSAIEESHCRGLIDQIPDGHMSVEARTFCLELLMTNRGRLADGD